MKFIKDEETQEPLDVEMYQLRETNQMIEEFMLLANISVAKKIHSSFPACAMLRRHPVPNANQFKEVIASVKRMGFDLNTENSKKLSDSLDEAWVRNFIEISWIFLMIV